MENISDSRQANSTKQIHGEWRFNKINARTEKGHLRDLCWIHCWETCFFSLDLRKKALVSSLSSCGVGKNWDLLKNKSDVSTSVRGTFKKSGSVVKDSSLLVGFLFSKPLERPVSAGGRDWGENIFCLVLCDSIAQSPRCMPFRKCIILYIIIK